MQGSNRRAAIVSLVALIAAVFASATNAADIAADFPSRPIRIIVGFPPGSGTDMLARFVGGKLTDRLGQQVVVDNRSGANGIIAAELTAKAPADGHTLLFMSVSHTMNAAIYKLPFDAVKSFTPVGMLASGPLVLVTHPSFPASSVRQLVELAKAKPNTISYAVSGTGGINHFAGALFARLAGIQLLDVPYRGGPQALTDLVGGQVQIMISTVAIAHRQVAAGKLKALGVSTTKRSALLPNVPTIAESGVKDYVMSTWWGVLAPPAMPAPIVTKLNGETAAILSQPDAAQRLENDGAEPAPLKSVEFGRLLASEVERWKRVARESNIKAE